MISATYYVMHSNRTSRTPPGGESVPASVRSFKTQTSCQTGRSGGAGFTLIELLVVILIIGVLGSALVVSVQSGYKQARQTNCKSNLRQFGVAVTIYRGEHDNRTPHWISNLYPDYVDDRGVYVCRADINRGTDTPRPEDLVKLIKDSGNAADKPALWDNEKNSDNKRNEAIECCSYLYEFSAAEPAGISGWYKGDTLPAGTVVKTMCDYKNVQLRYGDQANIVNGKQMPYSASRVPIIRCFHHFRDQKVICWQNSATGTKTGSTKKDYITLNVAYAGNVFVGPTWWEGTMHPGEAQQ